MRSEIRTPPTRNRRTAHAAVVLGILTLAALSTPALADRRHAERHTRIERRVHFNAPVPPVTLRHRRHVELRRVVVPRRIRRAEVEAYRPYYRGTVYHAPHRHGHTVYSFPVRTRAGLVLRPHYYCAHRLHDSRLTVHTPHGSVSLGF